MSSALDCLTPTLPEQSSWPMLHEIEAAFFSGQVYTQAIAYLTKQFGSASREIEQCLELVSREAIRLVAQQYLSFQSGPTVEPETPPQDCAPSPVITDSISPLEQNPVQPEVDLQLTQASSLSSTTVDELIHQCLSSSFPEVPQPGKGRKKLKPSPAELALQREDYLRRVGTLLAELRRSQSFSLEQLHEKTRIPLHQLKALEAGQVNHLPETIYVRGFIQRIASVLGVDGSQLANALPLTDPQEGVLPSWNQTSRQSPSKFCFNAVHLYVGYGALMAGAIGGLNYVANQSTSSVTPIPDQALPEQPAAAQADQSQATTCKANLKAAQRVGIANPEVVPVELSSAWSSH